MTKRYDPNSVHGMKDRPDGAFVHYSDYQKLVRALDHVRECARSEEAVIEVAIGALRAAGEIV